MRCPSCREALDGRELRCSSGHGFQIVDGVLRLLEPAFAARLETFLDGFRSLRERDGRRILDPTIYPRLPFAAELRHDPEWRMRCYDLRVIRRLVADRRPGTALDIGAYNGWLSHRLALDGHRVTAVDYFVDECDGIGAHRFYPTTWRPIQMDLRDLSILEDRFDLVVLNRCVQFSVDPPGMVARALERVADGGVLVITGIEIFVDPVLRRRGVEALADRLRRNGIEPFVPIKGYLDRGDERGFRSLGVDLRPYPELRMRLSRLRSRFDPRRGKSCFGVWRG
jgi:SAM-dependent methyltransferase